MEIAIIKRETTGSGPVNVFTENETIAKYEIMDGAPVKGDCFFLLILIVYSYNLFSTRKR